jgi:transposase
MGLRRHNSRLVRQLLTFIEKAPETSVLEIKPAQFNDETLKQEFNTDTRFIIGFNPAVQKQVRTHREQKLTDFENWRKELVTAGSLEEVTKSHQKVLTYLNQKKLKRFYSVSTSESDGQFKIEILQNDTVLAEEKLLDGHYFIQTEVKEQQLTDSEVVVAYKSLQKVERVFRVLKNNIELRPIYVRKEKRIRGHVFICFLTYLIECLMEKTLAEHLPDYSLEQMKIELARVKLVPVTLNNRIDGKKQNLFFITGGNREVQTFYSALKIKNFRHPEKMYFEKKNDCSDNFFRQLSLIPLFSNTPLD